jgi:hypothetical protein
LIFRAPMQDDFVLDVSRQRLVLRGSGRENHGGRVPRSC